MVVLLSRHLDYTTRYSINYSINYSITLQRELVISIGYLGFTKIIIKLINVCSGYWTIIDQFDHIEIQILVGACSAD